MNFINGRISVVSDGNGDSLNAIASVVLFRHGHVYVQIVGPVGRYHRSVFKLRDPLDGAAGIIRRAGKGFCRSIEPIYAVVVRDVELAVVSKGSGESFRRVNEDSPFLRTRGQLSVSTHKFPRVSSSMR